MHETISTWEPLIYSFMQKIAYLAHMDWKPFNTSQTYRRHTFYVLASPLKILYYQGLKV